MQHHPEPADPVIALGHPERLAAGLDQLFGPGDPPGHRRLGDQEGPGDLGGAEPADRAQGEGDLGRRRQGRVTAQKSRIKVSSDSETG